VHVTCDFCELYIEHRREIAALLQANHHGPQAGSTRPSNHSQGGKPTMDRTQFNLPDMWADHHVLKVRAVLTALQSVQDVVASSAFRMVSLAYDPAVITPDAIKAALEKAGYVVPADGKGAEAQPIPGARGRDPAWTRLGTRQIKTDERDLKTKR
jgi:copper chaperone CopZ